MSYSKPPYQLSPEIYNLSIDIQQILGELKSIQLAKPSVKLRKENKIKTVHHSLAIEGNSLTIDQVTALLENKRVYGPKNQITEVVNALAAYEDISKYNSTKETELKKAHAILTKNLVHVSGEYRNSNVGILKGTKISHVAPQAKMVTALMKNLFKYLIDVTEKSYLIKACVFHYELEFIHPFEDGNGRIGRLWQQLILMKHSEVFQYVSIESLIYKEQKKYYQVLETCDKAGDSTAFIEFSLTLILKALQQFQKEYLPKRITSEERILFAKEHFKKKEFSRKNYIQLFETISTATASRDLAAAVEKKIFKISGDKSNAKYRSL